METLGSIMARSVNKRGGLLNAKINGFTKVPNLFLMRQDIGTYEKMIMIILKKHKMYNPTCWPSMKTIAEEARCSETTVKKTIKSLKNKKLLFISKERGIKSNVYIIVI
jgi:DNA-binding MarR family transcriptional regulator